LRETPDRYVLDGPLPPLAVPTTLQASLLARLDRLGSIKDVAQVGAAIGREFSHELIAAVSALAAMDLDAALEQLTASGLISRRGTPPNATYSFKHALVQDAAYVTMLKSRRRQLHSSIATVLVERFPAITENLPEVVAHHFTEAGLASKAIGYWLKAGRLAYARWANREAVASFEQAMHLLEAHRLATGKGVRVAIIDSGVDAESPEIAGRIVARYDTVGGKFQPHPHGTAIAGAILAHSKLLGVAPDAEVIAVRAALREEGSFGA